MPQGARRGPALSPFIPTEMRTQHAPVHKQARAHTFCVWPGQTHITRAKNSQKNQISDAPSAQARARSVQHLVVGEIGAHMQAIVMPAVL
jgi:hypothetical protein